MIYTLTRDDIPSLSAWIKKLRTSEEVLCFLTVRLTFESQFNNSEVNCTLLIYTEFQQTTFTKGFLVLCK